MDSKLLFLIVVCLGIWHCRGIPVEKSKIGRLGDARASYQYVLNCANECKCGVGAIMCIRETGCVCETGWTGEKCNIDKDECSDFPCTDSNEICINNAGSYTCSCATGFKRNEDDACEDINECSDSALNDCSQICTNTPGGYQCPCDIVSEDDDASCTGTLVEKAENGRIGDACASDQYGLNCANECRCGVGAIKCNHKTGCVCETGWTGEKCNIDKDECTDFPCTDSNEICINNVGSYTCSCETGFKRNDACEDINECSDSTLNNCSQICTNTLGGYQCSCDIGSEEGGTSCTEDLAAVLPQETNCKMWESA